MSVLECKCFHSGPATRSLGQSAVLLKDEIVGPRTTHDNPRRVVISQSHSDSALFCCKDSLGWLGSSRPHRWLRCQAHFHLNLGSPIQAHLQSKIGHVLRAQTDQPGDSYGRKPGQERAAGKRPGALFRCRIYGAFRDRRSLITRPGFADEVGDRGRYLCM